jgi:hypothetical protein
VLILPLSIPRIAVSFGLGRAGNCTSDNSVCPNVTMKARSLLTSAAAFGLIFAAIPLHAAAFNLADSAFNVDGVVTTPGVPAGVNDSLFDYTTGLGAITSTIASSGSHFVGLYVDHEIDEAINTFFNEYGAPVNLPGLGQTWEIDEPGFAAPFGDIYDHFLASNSGASALENSSGVPSVAPNDVAMAMGWNLDLTPGQRATITFLLSDTAPSSGFYLEHIDPDSAAAIYFSSSTDIVTRPGVPDTGASLPLLLLSLASLGFTARAVCHLSR